MTTATRLTDAEGSEIVRRFNMPMTDEGYRAWYRNDVKKLLDEVMALRHERATAMGIFAANPPLEGVDKNLDMGEVANHLAQLWTEQQEGLWQRAEVKRIRESLATTKITLANTLADRDETIKRLGMLEGHIKDLKAKIVDTLADGQREVANVAAERDEKVKRIHVLEDQVRDLEAKAQEAAADCQRAVRDLQKSFADDKRKVRLLLGQVTSLLAE